MDTTQFHTQYAASMAAFLSQLPDPGLRIAVRQQGDPFFRQCALAVWQAGGTPLSPGRPVLGTDRPGRWVHRPSRAPLFLPVMYLRPPDRPQDRPGLSGYPGRRADPLRPGRRPRDPGGSIGHRVLSGPVVHPMAAGEPAGKPRTPCPFPARLPRSAACAYPRPRPSDPRSLRPDGGAHDRGPVGPAGRAVWTGNR